MDEKRMEEIGKALKGLLIVKMKPEQGLLEQDKGTNIITLPNTVQNVAAVVPPHLRTADVVASLVKQENNKKIKESSIQTYQEKLDRFAERFPFLPETLDPIMDYLNQFDGETGRHRRNNQDAIKMLYAHDVLFFDFPKNPMDKLERTQVTHKPVKILNWNQVQIFIKMPETPGETVAMELLIGHGWRQVEVRHIVAKDVAEISEDTILCHGKEREELAPILPQTQKLLKQMAKGLKPGDQLFVSQDGKKKPLGEDGMAQLATRLFKRGGIKGFTGHDLRRTFATMVTIASKDELLAMRLIRDTVPGVGRRYISFPMAQLVEALKKYSPVSHPEETEESGDPKAPQTQIIDGGDGGELNSTTLENPILLACSLLDQLAALGETANQLRTVLRNSHPQKKELLSNILKINQSI